MLLLGWSWKMAEAGESESESERKNNFNHFNRIPHLYLPIIFHSMRKNMHWTNRTWEIIEAFSKVIKSVWCSADLSELPATALKMINLNQAHGGRCSRWACYAFDVLVAHVVGYICCRSHIYPRINHKYVANVYAKAILTYVNVSHQMLNAFNRKKRVISFHDVRIFFIIIQIRNYLSIEYLRDYWY